MKNKLFYILTNKLYEMKFQMYISYLKNNILNQSWFKKACKEKKIKIVYLSKNILENSTKAPIKIAEDKIYFHKLFLVKFEYENLENSNHIKLLNINIKNETLYKVVSFLVELQHKFLKTNYYQDALIMDRNFFISEYIKKYNTYLDAAVLSKILNNTFYISNGNKSKLLNLINSKTYIYSLYIKEIINKSSSINSDMGISRIMKSKYNIEISRRKICYIRNKYLIPKFNNQEKFSFYKFNEKLFNEKKELNRKNLEKLKKNIKGIYELSSNNAEKYPFSKNRVIYIGSSNDIKKRLSSYTEKNAHSKKIRDFLKSKDKIYFRLIKTSHYKEYEMLFLEAFHNMCGLLPKLNKQRILNFSTCVNLL